MKANTTTTRSLFLAPFVLVLIIVFGQMAISQETEPPEIDVAQGALEVYLENFVDEENYGDFGFGDPSEVAAARVGNPLPVAFIGLQDLQAYRPGGEAVDLIQDANTYWYPVISNGETRTKMELVRVDETWIPGEFGGVRTVQAVADARRTLASFVEAEGIDLQQQASLVDVPALNATLLYFRSEGREFALPAMVDPERYDLEQDQIYSADEPLMLLSEFAQGIDPEKTM